MVTGHDYLQVMAMHPDHAEQGSGAAHAALLESIRRPQKWGYAIVLYDVPKEQLLPDGRH